MVKWIGSFGSQKYGTLFVSGDIEMQLPENINVYPVEASYDVIYRGIIGGGTRFQGKINLVNDKEMQIIVLGNKTVIFYINEKSNSKLSGTYSLDSPSDNGLFELFRQ